MVLDGKSSQEYPVNMGVLKSLLKTFLRILIFVILVLYLRVCPSRTNLKPYNISVTPKLVKKVIRNLDSSKAPGSDSIPGVVLQNREPELSHVLDELFNMCRKESRLLEGIVSDPCI